MRFLTLAAAFALFTAPAIAAPDLSKMHLTFHDEFNSKVLDDTKWNPHYTNPSVINNELEAFTPDAVVPDATNGVLRLRADKRQVAGMNFTSGAITSMGKFGQTYGYFEMRVKLPSGAGLWPAFWLLPQNGSWPPEIDIFEYLGRTPQHIYMSLLWGGKGVRAGTKTNDVVAKIPGNDLTLWYHRVGLEWRPGVMIWYLDGIEVARLEGSNVPSQPMYILANLAIGGNWNGAVGADTKFPAVMDIDYIRAYQYNDIADAPAPPMLINRVDISKPVVKAGDTLTVSATLKTGTGVSAQVSTQFFIFDFFNQKRQASATVVQKGVKAGDVLHPTADIQLPAGMADGLYNVAILTTGSTIWLTKRFEVRNGAASSLPALASLPAPPDRINPPIIVLPPPAISTATSSATIVMNPMTLSNANLRRGDTITIPASITAKADLRNVIYKVDVRDAAGKSVKNFTTTTALLAAGKTLAFNNQYTVPNDLPDGFYTIYPQVATSNGFGFQTVAAQFSVNASGTPPLAAAGDKFVDTLAGTNPSPAQAGTTTGTGTTPGTSTGATTGATTTVKLPALSKPNNMGVELGAATTDATLYKAGATGTVNFSFKALKDMQMKSADTILIVWNSSGKKVLSTVKGLTGNITAGTTVPVSMNFKLPANLPAGIYKLQTQVWSPNIGAYQSVAAAFEVK